jgi:TonB family protein
MWKLVLVVLSLAVCACVAGPPAGTSPAPAGQPSFEEGWRFLDGSVPGPSDEVAPPLLKSRPNAVYPIEARKQRYVGDVGIEITVDETGQVSDVQVVSPLEPTMDEAAVKAYWEAKFLPARLNDVAKASVVRERVSFALH